MLQQRKDTLEAELQNTQENLKQLLADGEAKKLCVENLAKDDKLFKFYTGFSYMQFQACFEFLVNRYLAFDTKESVTTNKKDK